MLVFHRSLSPHIFQGPSPSATICVLITSTPGSLTLLSLPKVDFRPTPSTASGHHGLDLACTSTSNKVAKPQPITFSPKLLLLLWVEPQFGWVVSTSFQLPRWSEEACLPSCSYSILCIHPPNHGTYLNCNIYACLFLSLNCRLLSLEARNVLIFVCPAPSTLLSIK